MEQDLYIAIIQQAVDDLESRSVRIRKEAIKFLCGTNKPWRNSLGLICSYAGIDSDLIMEYYRKKLGVKVDD